MVFERFVYNCKAVRRTLAGLRHNDNHAVRERTVDRARRPGASRSWESCRDPHCVAQFIGGVS